MYLPWDPIGVLSDGVTVIRGGDVVLKGEISGVWIDFLLLIV